jgi:hypothetical protein
MKSAIFYLIRPKLIDATHKYIYSLLLCPELDVEDLSKFIH